jgi:hypothetical protein
MIRSAPPAGLIIISSILAAILLTAFGNPQKDYNAYVPGSFPAQVSSRVFEILLDPASLLVVIPSGLEAKKPAIGSLLSKKCGGPIPFRGAGALQAADLRGKNLILVGNIMNNPWLLEMYMKRRAFADAYFPGAGGFFVHPAKSIWDPARNMLVIGVSRDEDPETAFSGFLDQIKPGSRSIGIVHLLKTVHGGRSLDLDFFNNPRCGTLCLGAYFEMVGTRRDSRHAETQEEGSAILLCSFGNYEGRDG